MQDLWLVFPKQVADCIDKIGSSEFYPYFFQLIKKIAQIDQYMVFEFSPSGDYATCRLAYNLEKPDLGLELASLYLEGAYLDDPMLTELKKSALCAAETQHCRLLEKRRLPPVYRKRFFNVPNFDSKFSLLVVDGQSQHIFYINFYSKKNNAFAKGQFELLEHLSPLVGSLLLKHFRDERKQRGVIKSLLVSGLSQREAQICNMILKGHTAKSMGDELELSESTIITYKKRAFNKLNITRKSDLTRFV